MAWNFDEAVSYYKKLGAPRDQNALIGLLREIQQENSGSIPKHMLEAIAYVYSIKDSLLLALIKRIPSLRLSDTHCLQLCGGPNCSKHTALVQSAQVLHTASGKKFALEFVPCMRMCAKGPNIRWDGVIYHKADEKLLQKLLTDAGIKF